MITDVREKLYFLGFVSLESLNIKKDNLEMTCLDESFEKIDLSNIDENYILIKEINDKEYLAVILAPYRDGEEIIATIGIMKVRGDIK